MSKGGGSDPKNTLYCLHVRRSRRWREGDLMALTPDGRAIERALAALNERGINVVETEEAEADEKEEETREKRESEETGSSELAEVTPKTPATYEAEGAR